MSINSIIIHGRLTRDPEIKTFGETSLTKISVAVDRAFKSNKENAQTVDFFDVDAFGKTGEFISKYFKKGQEIIVRGKMQLNSGTDKDGKTRVYPAIVCEEAGFAGSKKDNGGGTPANTAISTGIKADELVDVAAIDEDDLPF